jgi:hypothetical protein
MSVDGRVRPQFRCSAAWLSVCCAEAFPSPPPAAQPTEAELRRKKAKGGSGKLPAPKLKKKYRAGRRKYGEPVVESEESNSQASDEGGPEADPRRTALISQTGRKPTGVQLRVLVRLHHPAVGVLPSHRV